MGPRERAPHLREVARALREHREERRRGGVTASGTPQVTSAGGRKGKGAGSPGGGSACGGGAGARRVGTISGLVRRFREEPPMSRRAREYSARKGDGGEASPSFWWLPEGGGARGGSARGVEEGLKGAARPATPPRPGTRAEHSAAAADAAGEELEAPLPMRVGIAVAGLGELPPPVSERAPEPAAGSLSLEEDEGEEEDILEAWRRRRHAQLQRLGLTKLALCARESPDETPPRRSGPAPPPRRRRLQLEPGSSDESNSNTDGEEDEGSPPAILAELGTHKEFLRTLSERLGLGVERTRSVAQPMRPSAPVEEEGRGEGKRAATGATTAAGGGARGQPSTSAGEPDASPPRPPELSAWYPLEGGSPAPTAAGESSLPPQRAAVEISACPGAGAPRLVEESPRVGASPPPFPPDMLAIPPELSPVLVQPERPENPAPLLQAQSGLFLLSPPGWATPPRPPTPSSEALRAFRSSPRAASPMLPSLLDLCSETVADNLFSYESESESGGEDEKEGADASEPEEEAGEALPQVCEASPEGLREAVETAALEEVAELIDAAVAAIAGTGSVAVEATADGEAGSAGDRHASDDAPIPEETENRALAAARQESPESHNAEVSHGTAEEQDEELQLLAEYRGWKEASAADTDLAPAPRLVDVQVGVAADPASGSGRSGATGEEAELLAAYHGWKDNLEQQKITAPAGEAAGDRTKVSYEGGGAAFPGEEGGDGGDRARGAEPLEEVSEAPSGQPGQLDHLACAELPLELEQVFLADLLGWESDLPAAVPGSAADILETAASILSPVAAVFQEAPPVDGHGGAVPLGPPVEQPLPGCLPAAAELRRAGEVAVAEPLFADDVVVRALTSRLQACLAHLPGEEGGGQ